METKKRILLVDDELDVVELVKMRLEANGYSVLTALDGKEALDTARKERPDLVILDLMLPKIDGYRVCAMLKHDQRYAKIPIILFTARAQESDVAMGTEAGGDCYIIKPFDPDVLLGKIKELLK